MLELNILKQQKLNWNSADQKKLEIYSFGVQAGDKHPLIKPGSGIEKNLPALRLNYRFLH